jgi:hypothetical protein
LPEIEDHYSTSSKNNKYGAVKSGIQTAPHLDRGEWSEEAVKPQVPSAKAQINFNDPNSSYSFKSFEIEIWSLFVVWNL